MWKIKATYNFFSGMAGYVIKNRFYIFINVHAILFICTLLYSLSQSRELRLLK